MRHLKPRLGQTRDKRRHLPNNNEKDPNIIKCAFKFRYLAMAARMAFREPLGCVFDNSVDHGVMTTLGVLKTKNNQIIWLV